MGVSESVGLVVGEAVGFEVDKPAGLTEGEYVCLAKGPSVGIGVGK